jgi:hypothetical protein
MPRAWVGKLDITLQHHLNGGAACPATVVDCMILTDSTAWSDVETLIEGHGGTVLHRIGIAPGLTAALPVRALGAIASSEHVLQVEADLGYEAF